MYTNRLLFSHGLHGFHAALTEFRGWPIRISHGCIYIPHAIILKMIAFSRRRARPITRRSRFLEQGRDHFREDWVFSKIVAPIFENRRRDAGILLPAFLFVGAILWLRIDAS